MSASDPSGPSAGWIYYNTTNDVMKVYDGSIWKEVTAEAPLGDQSNPASSAQALRAAPNFLLSSLYIIVSFICISIGIYIEIEPV